MKKLICFFALIFAIVCVFSLTACGQSKKYTMEECFTVTLRDGFFTQDNVTISDIIGTEKTKFYIGWQIKTTKAVKITKISYKFYDSEYFKGTVIIDNTSPLNAPILKEYQANEIIDISKFFNEFEKTNNSTFGTIDTTLTDYYGFVYPVPAQVDGMYNLEIEFSVIE